MAQRPDEKLRQKKLFPDAVPSIFSKSSQNSDQDISDEQSDSNEVSITKNEENSGGEDPLVSEYEEHSIMDEKEMTPPLSETQVDINMNFFIYGHG